MAGEIIKVRLTLQFDKTMYTSFLRVGELYIDIGYFVMTGDTQYIVIAGA